MRLEARTVVSNYIALTDPMIDDYVKRTLAHEISHEILKNMNITSTLDSVNDTTIYTGSLTVGVPYTTTALGTNSYIPEHLKLRVVEFKKNGKVTRVELQYYDDSTGWNKVQRVTQEDV